MVTRVTKTNILENIKKVVIDGWKSYGANNAVRNILINEYLNTHVLTNPKYANTKRLNRHEFQAFSQNGEDGIIEEIFNRIGTTNKYFVEFGAGYGGRGMENNTLFLYLKGWRGVWMDANEKSIKKLTVYHDTCLDIDWLEHYVIIQKAIVTAENVESLFAGFHVPTEFDFLCIDIDGNDYYVWQAIQKYQPRVVMIEYVSTLGAKLDWKMHYNKDYICGKTPKGLHWAAMLGGSSLKALELLGAEKGYCLVGCDFTGTNAFFVRKDLVHDKFQEPFTSENHYEPSRSFLTTHNHLI